MSCGSDADAAKTAMLLTYAKNPEKVEQYIDSLIFKDDGTEHLGNVTGFKNADEVKNAVFNGEYTQIGDKFVAVMDKDNLVGYVTGAADQMAMMIPNPNGSGMIPISTEGIKSNLLVLTTTTNDAGDMELTAGGPALSVDTFTDKSMIIADDIVEKATNLAASRGIPMTIGILSEANDGKPVVVTTRTDNTAYYSNFPDPPEPTPTQTT